MMITVNNESINFFQVQSFQPFELVEMVGKRSDGGKGNESVLQTLLIDELAAKDDEIGETSCAYESGHSCTPFSVSKHNYLVQPQQFSNAIQNRRLKIISHKKLRQFGYTGSFVLFSLFIQFEEMF